MNILILNPKNKCYIHFIWNELGSNGGWEIRINVIFISFWNELGSMVDER